MSDMTLTDMTPFFERHERKSRRAIVALTCTSLAVAAGIFAYGAVTAGEPRALLAKLWGPIVVYPLLGVVFWIGTELYARTRMPLVARRSMNPDDARNAARVANAALISLSCLGLVMIATQAGVALGYFGVLPPLKVSGNWIARASLVATGGFLIYFGNAWSKAPMPHTPEHRAAAMMKYKRRIAWLTVIHGMLLGLAALFLPRLTMEIGAGALGISLVLSMIVCILILNNELKPRSTS
jgi:hypothetical protein